MKNIVCEYSPPTSQARTPNKTRAHKVRSKAAASPGKALGGINIEIQHSGAPSGQSLDNSGDLSLDYTQASHDLLCQRNTEPSSDLVCQMKSIPTCPVFSIGFEQSEIPIQTYQSVFDKGVEDQVELSPSQYCSDGFEGLDSCLSYIPHSDLSLKEVATRKSCVTFRIQGKSHMSLREE